MNPYHFAYNLVASGLFPIALPLVWWHERRDPQRRSALAQRLGYDPQQPDPALSDGPKIWIHAVSVGEVKATEAVIDALTSARAKVSILLTTTTMTGQRYARQQFDGRATVRYAPLDLWWAIGRFLAVHRPDLLVCMETEIWPNWITRAYGAGINTVFINGRLSNRSIRSYQRIRWLIKPVLEKVDLFSMISAADAKRIIALGAPTQRVRINGNVKMDARDLDASDAAIEKLKRLFAVDDHTAVFIAGSIRGAEAELLMAVYARLALAVPNLLFIIAPRHIEKSPRIAALADANGIRWQYRTDLGNRATRRQAPLLILNTIGELRFVYSIARVVFCGASLVPLGGQNVLEAAAWAKPVLFGPSMEDFAEARTLLERFGGGVCVKDTTELGDWAMDLLTHPGKARRLGRLAKQAACYHRGAAQRHAEVIIDLLPEP